jgi:hypothetical protein
MSDSKIRPPESLTPIGIVYEPSLLTRRKYFAFLFAALFVCFCSASMLGINQAQKTFRASMTKMAISRSTARMALTQTAMPTKTPTLTPTITLTPTQTYTPTLTLTPTLTPVLSWSKSVVDSSSNRPSYFLSMDISKNGKYYLAYLLDRSDDLMVVEGNGNSWKPLRNLSQLNKEGRAVGFNISLDIENSETPYLAYLIYDKEIGRGAVLVSDGTWSTATIGQNIQVLDMRIALDDRATPHFAILSKNGEIYYRSANTSLATVQTGVLPPPLVDVLANYYPITLAVDSNQNPTICYSRLGKLECIHQSGESWISTVVADNGIYPSLQIDGSGNLHLAYYDYQEQTLHYAFLSKGSSRWQTFRVDASENVGLYPSLRIDSNDLAHISYYDAGNTALKYAVGRLDGWSVYTVDNDGNVGLTSSLVLDDQDRPAIAYYDSERKRIYFVTSHQK